jgi:hypothetical protein
VFEEMSARKYFPKIERNLLGLDGDSSYNTRSVVLVLDLMSIDSPIKELLKLMEKLEFDLDFGIVVNHLRGLLSLHHKGCSYPSEGFERE